MFDTAIKAPGPSLATLGDGARGALSAALTGAGYTADAVGEARRRQRYLPRDDALATAGLAGGDVRLESIVRLLALGQPVGLTEARAALAPAALEDLQEAGLVAREGDSAIADCCLLPQDGLLLAGDGADGGERDLVHAFTQPSLALARLLPRTRRRSMLDLGTGSGILALLGAGWCDQVTAVDVNPRALMFARFNAGLNQIGNVELLEGSWFEPVADRRFDLIVGNLPYVVSPDQEFTYRDSGLPPGALLELICHQAAAHLEPDGLAIFLSSWPHSSEADWPDAPTAAVSGTGCDGVILCQSKVEPLEHAVRWNTPPVRLLDPESLRETVARWVAYYEGIGAGRISFGAVVLRRRGSGEPWLTALEAPAAFGERASEQLARLLRGRDLGDAHDDRALLTRRLSLPDGIDVSQRFQRRSARFVMRPAMVSLTDGLGVRAAVDPDALEVLFACDGSRTLGEIVEEHARRGGAEVGSLARTAAGAARELLAHGLLEAD